MWKGRIQNHMSSESKSVERTRKLCFGGAVQTPQLLHGIQRCVAVCACLALLSVLASMCLQVLSMKYTSRMEFDTCIWRSGTHVNVDS